MLLTVGPVVELFTFLARLIGTNDAHSLNIADRKSQPVNPTDVSASDSVRCFRIERQTSDLIRNGILIKQQTP